MEEPVNNRIEEAFIAWHGDGEHLDPGGDVTACCRSSFRAGYLAALDAAEKAMPPESHHACGEDYDHGYVDGVNEVREIIGHSLAALRSK